MLGAALAAAFRKGPTDDPRVPFDGVRRFICSHIDSYVRRELFLINVSLTSIFVCVLVLLFWFTGAEKVYLLAAGAGVLGAMISALQRYNKTSFGPHRSMLDLCSESISRLAIGVILGLLVVLCAKADFLITAYKDNLYGITFFAFLAGFSERFIPGMMQQTAKPDIPRDRRLTPAGRHTVDGVFQPPPKPVDTNCLLSYICESGTVFKLWRSQPKSGSKRTARSSSRRQGGDSPGRR